MENDFIFINCIIKLISFWLSVVWYTIYKKDFSNKNKYLGVFQTQYTGMWITLIKLRNLKLFLEGGEGAIF